MNNNYKLVYGGALKAGTDVEHFIRHFMQMFKASEEQARRLVTLGRAITLKDNLEQATAEKYRQAMEQLGMQVHVEPMAASIASHGPLSVPPTQAAEAQPAASNSERCPKCGSERVKDDDCLACGIIISRYRERQERLSAQNDAQQDNPYAAPQSDVRPAQHVEPGIMNGPHNRPAGNGWHWIAGGWNHFRRNPFAWIGALLVWMVLMMAGSLIPFIGSLAINLLAPVFTAGFMLGADAQRKGDNFEVGHLFSGFSHNTGSLVLVGLFYLLGMLLTVAIVAVMVGGTLFAMGDTLQSGNADPRMVAGMLGGPLLLALLVALALWMPLMMAYWFAPMLVALEGIAPFKAMKLSFSACLKNILPFLIYSLIAMLLMILAVLPLGLGLLVLMPVMLAAMYASYRDIFYEQQLV